MATPVSPMDITLRFGSKNDVNFIVYRNISVYFQKNKVWFCVCYHWCIVCIKAKETLTCYSKYVSRNFCTFHLISDNATDIPCICVVYFQSFVDAYCSLRLQVQLPNGNANVKIITISWQGLE